MANELAVKDKFLKETVELQKGIERTFIVLAGRLKKIRDEELFAPSYENFAEFLLEMNMSEGNVSKLIKVYEVWMLALHFKEKDLMESRGWSSLYTGIKYIPVSEDGEYDKKKAIEILRDSTIMFRKDFEDKYAGRDDHESKCRHSDTYDVRICKGCGKKTKIYKED